MGTVLLFCALPMAAAPAYYWRTLPVGKPETAQLLTLFCAGCGMERQDVPLISVLRDTLGQTDVADHKVTAVWLLSYSHPTIAQRSLAAIPFFYWSLSDGSSHVKTKDTTPLLDLSAPENPAVSSVERQLLQWTALDTIDTPVRASSREYRTNAEDHERLHLEEANSYLLNAPVGNAPDELTPDERDFVMARLELRKKLLGGFVGSSRANMLGQEAGFEQERVRSRNWELLRQCAEKTGLVFEPMELAGSGQQYAMLWYPERGLLEPGGDNLAPIWKLLSMKDPYSDSRLLNWKGYTKNGTLGPSGRPDKLIPLGFYSLSYPRQPLLLVDFRDARNLRKRDLTQKSIDEVTSGVIGLSHFTNWYYFVAADVINFVQERRGKTNNRAERLDSYSEFRVALALDHDLDPALRSELVKRSDSISSNPLEASPANEMASAVQRYSLLTAEAAGDGSRLVKRIDNERRAELASFSATPRREGVDIALHAVTLGEYTHRAKAKKDDEDLALLITYRRVEYNLDFLDRLVAAGTAPEVAYQPERVRASVAELTRLMPDIAATPVRDHVRATLQSLGKISGDETLRAACDRESHKLMEDKTLSPSSVPGILAEPAIHEFN
jgi:hypothetical protein